MIEITATVNMPQLAELERRLRALPADVERDLVGQALPKGAAVIVAAAQSAAPVGRRHYQYGRHRVPNRRRIGQLRRSIRVIGRAKKQSGALVLPIGFGAPGYYGRFIERGWTPTGPHAQWRAQRRLGAHAARRVLQQGRPKIPGLRFMHRAALQQMGAATEAVARAVERGLRQWGA